MTQVQEPINLMQNDLMTSNSLFNSSDYLSKINTLQYVQNNDPNMGYQISIPSNNNIYINNNLTANGQLQIDVTHVPYMPEEDYSKLYL